MPNQLYDGHHFIENSEAISIALYTSKHRLSKKVLVPPGNYFAGEKRGHMEAGIGTLF